MVYIQKNNDGMPHHFDCACALYGAQDLGLDYKLVTMEEVQEGKWDNLIRQRLFVGSVEFMTEVFKRVGIEQPRLPLNNLREEKRMPMSEFQYEKPVFIKPTQIKLFTGTVVDEFMAEQYKRNYSDAEIIVQEVIPNIESEFRVYVFRGKIADIKHYSGKLLTDTYGAYNFVDKLLKGDKLDGFPPAFTVDVATYHKHPKITFKTVIEFNDMWAIGNYGVSNDLYVRMLKERYFDIIKNGK